MVGTFGRAGSRSLLAVLIAGVVFLAAFAERPESAGAAGPGEDWVSQTTSANNFWQSVTFGNGLFVAVATSGVGNRVMTSPDGVNWTTRTSAADNPWTSVTFGNGLFVAVSSNG